MSVKKIFISVIMAGVISLTGTVSALALNNAPQSAAGPVQINKGQLYEKIKSNLDTLVKEGTITKVQEDAVIKALAARKDKAGLKDHRDGIPKGNEPCKDGKCKPKNHKKHGILRELVKDGTISREQAAAIKAAIKSARESLRNSN